MKRQLVISSAGLVALCLAGWVALAWGQPAPEPGPVAEPADYPTLPSTAPPAPTFSGTVPSLPTSPAVPETVPGIPTSPPLQDTVMPPTTPTTMSPLPSGPLPGGPPLPSEPEPTPEPAEAPVTATGSQPRQDLGSPSPVPYSGAMPTYPTSTVPEQPASPATQTTPQAIPTTLPGLEQNPGAQEKKPEDVLVPSINPEGAMGRQEPAVSMEWVGPPAAKVAQALDYSLVVRNTGTSPVQQVLVRVRIPTGITVQDTEPKAVPEDSVLVWDLGTLLAKQDRVLRMKMTAESKGEFTPQAWVTFTGSSVMRVRIREPKLVLKANAPEKVLVGDAVAFSLSVSNPGDGSADQVRIRAALSEGLEHARGNNVDFEIGNLAAGETRTIQVICAAKSGGEQRCEATAESTGGLKATDSTTVNVIKPRLDLEVAGPGLRYLERKAIYSVRVTNPGDAPATNVTVGHMVPVGFKVLAASDGGRHDFSTRTVSWFLGEIPPGKVREVKLEVQAISPGEHVHKATAIGARGLRAEAEMSTRVEGLSALMLEMVDTEDPIEVNAQTAYEIRITNTGSKTENDIKLVAIIPEEMEFIGAQGPVRYRAEGKMVVFDALPKLAPRADAIFRLNVKAKKPDIVRFEIRVTSANLTEPVIKMEPTRIYSDAPETASGQRQER